MNIPCILWGCKQAQGDCGLFMVTQLRKKDHWTYIQFSWLQIGCSFKETNCFDRGHLSLPPYLQSPTIDKVKIQSLVLGQGRGCGVSNVRTTFCLLFPSQASWHSLGVTACHQCGVISLWGPRLSQWTSDFLLRCCVRFTNSLIFCKMHEHFLIEKQFRNAEHIIVMK